MPSRIWLGWYQLNIIVTHNIRQLQKDVVESLITENVSCTLFQAIINYMEYRTNQNENARSKRVAMCFFTVCPALSLLPSSTDNDVLANADEKCFIVLIKPTYHIIAIDSYLQQLLFGIVLQLYATPSFSVRDINARNESLVRISRALNRA